MRRVCRRLLRRGWLPRSVCGKNVDSAGEIGPGRVGPALTCVAPAQPPARCRKRNGASQTMEALHDYLRLSPAVVNHIAADLKLEDDAEARWEKVQ